MIRVQNVYYMLAYAFQVLHEQGYKNVATEEFDNVAELLSAILCRGVSVQIKRGLIRQYISREEALASPRGKLEIGESIKTQVIRKKQLICNYDEFSVDAYPNRIIKTTMDLLLRGSISKARKKEIRKLMIFFDGISILDIFATLSSDEFKKTAAAKKNLCGCRSNWRLEAKKSPVVPGK